MSTTSAALSLFRTRLFEAMLNPDKIPLEDVMRSFQAWEATMLRDETDCHQNIQRYLERHHTERLEHETKYTEYKQYLQETKQSYEASTLGNRMKTRRQYLNACIKPDSMLYVPSTVYTIDVDVTIQK